MASLHLDNVTKPVDPITEDTIPDATHEHLAAALEALVEHSATHVDLGSSPPLITPSDPTDQQPQEGVIFDSSESVESILPFVQTYSLQLDELLEPDTTKYTCFNEFFYRKLKPDARPVQNGDDPNGICSAADCRLMVYPSMDIAKEIWVKGRNFDIPNLLNVRPNSDTAKIFTGSSVAIFRLAPADYHRFHSPIDGEVGEIVHIPGQYYTVNPQAVNQPGFDVFTANTRSVLYMKHTVTGLPVAFVAIGALLVGSIKWTGGANKGGTIKRGEEVGYFAYGGSTVVVLFPQGVVKFDEDLLKNSEADEPIETLVKVGYSLGKTPPPGPAQKLNWVKRAREQLSAKFKPLNQKIGAARVGMGKKRSSRSGVPEVGEKAK